MFIGIWLTEEMKSLHNQCGKMHACVYKISIPFALEENVCSSDWFAIFNNKNEVYIFPGLL